MKKLTALSAFILTVTAVSVSLFYSSCKKDACKEVLCLNGGTCNDGTCSCLSGFTGTDCSVVNHTTTPPPPAAKKTYKVTYEIGCTDCQVIYYSDSMQTQAVEDHQNSSWTYTFYGKKGQEVLLFAYNTSSQAQGVTATIKLNDTTTLTSYTNYCPISGYSFVVDTLQ